MVVSGASVVVVVVLRCLGLVRRLVLVGFEVVVAAVVKNPSLLFGTLLVLPAAMGSDDNTTCSN